MLRSWLAGLFLCSAITGMSQQKDVTELVNVFLGSSGDHGQLSPAASYPFSTLSICPLTDPATHTGYEFLAKKVLGFTHNRMEGVGCKGSGGNILITPFSGSRYDARQPLMKAGETAGPGYYHCRFTNGIQAAIAVEQQNGIHHYTFPKGSKGIHVNLAQATGNAFVAETHTVEGNVMYGFVDSRTTCNVGVFRTYYRIELNQPVAWISLGKAQLVAMLNTDSTDVLLRISFSSVDEAHATAKQSRWSADSIRAKSQQEWGRLLQTIAVTGGKEQQALFYSLFYRTLQSPYVISEADGQYRNIDGSLATATQKRYNGWAIWDNYKTQLPLLSILYPEMYQDVVTSLANLYRYGKKDFATGKEPSNTVRTEHAIVVLLDAYRKGFTVDFAEIRDSLLAETDRLDVATPDKALESAYDAWAMAEILKILKEDSLSQVYRLKAARYKTVWEKEFKHLDKPDVDKMAARGMYQGTIRQYRWSVPFDVKGLREIAGGEEAFRAQLNEFFDEEYYNRTNEPDMQAPALYNATSEPWKYQALIQKFTSDTIVNYYFNDNSRGIGAEIDRIYKNRPDAYIRTMDDDAGAMSGWYVLSALGLQPACVGWPVYYLNVPLFASASVKWPGGKSFAVSVQHFKPGNCYISEVFLNGKKLSRNWLTHQEIMAGGRLIITASARPDTMLQDKEPWFSDMNK